MNSLLESLRRFARLTFAAVVWLHALFLLSLNLPIVKPIASATRTTVNEAAILTLIACASVLSAYGWKNIIIDLLYFYFFPFVLLFYLSKACYKLLRFVALFHDRPTHIEAQPTSSAIAVSSAATSHTNNTRIGLKGFFETCLTPITKFILLWSLLLLLSSHLWLIRLALVIVLIQLCKTLYSIATSVLNSVAWLATVESRITEQAEAVISKIMSASHVEAGDTTLQEAWRQWKAFERGIAIMRSGRRAGNVAIFLSMLVFSAVYLYLSFLFSFAYVGLAKAQGLQFGWAEALAASLFIPVAYSDLPHNVVIKIVGGIQWLSVLGLGGGTIYGYMNTKLQSLTEIAHSLNNRFSAESVRTKLVILDNVFAVKKAAAGTSTVAEDTATRMSQ